MSEPATPGAGDVTTDQAEFGEDELQQLLRTLQSGMAGDMPLDLEGIVSTFAAGMEASMLEETDSTAPEVEPKTEVLAAAAAEQAGDTAAGDDGSDLDDLDDLDVDMDELEPIPSGFQASSLFSPMGDMGAVPGLGGLQSSMMRELLQDEGEARPLMSRSNSMHEAPNLRRSTSVEVDVNDLLLPPTLQSSRLRGPGGGATVPLDDDELDELGDFADAETVDRTPDASSKEEFRMLMSVFSEDQQRRYEVFRRSLLAKNVLRKLLASIMQQQVSATLAFVVNGFTKVFVGEIIEIARDVMLERGQDGPLRPEHLREAQRIYRARRPTPANMLYRRPPPSNF